jgi:hypothetical protein
MSDMDLSDLLFFFILSPIKKISIDFKPIKSKIYLNKLFVLKQQKNRMLNKY